MVTREGKTEGGDCIWGSTLGAIEKSEADTRDAHGSKEVNLRHAHKPHFHLS